MSNIDYKEMRTHFASEFIQNHVWTFQQRFSQAVMCEKYPEKINIINDFNLMLGQF